MKKFFSMMAVVAAMFTFAACGEEAPQDPAPQKPAQKTQLEKPVVTITNVTETGFTVEWEAVANATEYLVYLNKDIQPKTTETSYTFTDLNAGKYQPRVKALGGENYKDSEYSDIETVTLTGATSVTWFTQTVALPVDSDELAAKGINSSNTITLNWSGDGVESLSYLCSHIDELPATDDAIISNMNALDASYLAEVNAEGGIDLQFDGLAGGQTYVVCALATKGGKEFLAKNEITTNATILTTSAAYWIGTWNARTEKMITFGETSVDVTEEVSDFTYTISQYDEYYSDYVYVDGQSVLNNIFGAGNGMFAYTGYTEEGHYVLSLYNPALFSDQGNGNYLAYLAFGDVEGLGSQDGVYFVAGQYPAIEFVSDGTTITCNMYQGNLNGGGTFTVSGMDIAFSDAQGSILGLPAFSLEDGSTYDHNTFRYGPVQILGEADATPAALSKKANNLSVADVMPVSCVVAM